MDDYQPVQALQALFDEVAHAEGVDDVERLVQAREARFGRWAPAEMARQANAWMEHHHGSIIDESEATSLLQVALAVFRDATLDTEDDDHDWYRNPNDPRIDIGNDDADDDAGEE